MRKIKYLAPILGLSALVGVAAPITACAKAAEETKVLPYNLLKIDGVTLKGIVDGTDLTKYETIDIPEGVKYIAEDAFNHVKTQWPDAEEETGTFDYTTVTNLILPSTLRGVDEKAFLGLSSLKSIDCTNWNADTIQYMEFADDCINEALWHNSRYIKVNLPEGLTLDQTNKVKSDFSVAGVPAWCFVDQTTGHIAATEGVSKTVNTTVTNETTVFDESAPYEPYQYAKGDAEISLTLTDTFDISKYELNVYPQKTSSTASYDEVANISEPAIEDNKIVKFTPLMISTQSMPEEYPEKTIYYPMLESEGHTVDFDLNFVCTKKSSGEVVWTQKVDGYKLTNAYTHVEKVEITNKPESGAYEGWLLSDPLEQKFTKLGSVTPAYKVTPENAVIQTVSYDTDDYSVLYPWVDTDGTKYVAGLNPGTANLLVQTDDSTGAYDTVQVDIVGAELYQGLVEPAKTTTELSTNMGHHEKDPSVTGDVDYSYGYLIPALPDGFTMKYRVTLDGTKVANDLLSPATTAGEYRTFGMFRNTNSGGGYTDIAVNTEVYGVYPELVRKNGDKVTLTEGKHFFMADGKIYLMDHSTDAQVLLDLTFADGDTLTFTFVLHNEEPILYTGFKFAVQA